jgi:hypothetical protein
VPMQSIVPSASASINAARSVASRSGGGLIFDRAASRLRTCSSVRQGDAASPRVTSTLSSRARLIRRRTPRSRDVAGHRRALVAGDRQVAPDDDAFGDRRVPGQASLADTALRIRATRQRQVFLVQASRRPVTDAY